mmetsp:Transcript_44328/g.102356  ORF Transcript_44328/g.102356 Transcript_44328/m.102356 type:complete len:215 (+) Transcript_44328:656-1300(+)
MSPASTRDMADSRSFSRRPFRRLHFLALAWATLRIGRALISRSLARNWSISSLEMGSSGLLYMFSSSVNHSGRHSSPSKVHLLYAASMSSILDFFDATRREPRARVSASSRGSFGFSNLLLLGSPGSSVVTKGLGGSNGATSRGRLSALSVFALFPRLSSCSRSRFRSNFRFALSVSGSLGSSLSSTSLISAPLPSRSSPEEGSSRLRPRVPPG